LHRPVYLGSSIRDAMNLTMGDSLMKRLRPSAKKGEKFFAILRDDDHLMGLLFWYGGDFLLELSMSNFWSSSICDRFSPKSLKWSSHRHRNSQ
jgi:hypothetical protein